MWRLHTLLCRLPRLVLSFYFLFSFSLFYSLYLLLHVSVNVFVCTRYSLLNFPSVHSILLFSLFFLPIQLCLSLSLPLSLYSFSLSLFTFTWMYQSISYVCIPMLYSSSRLLFNLPEVFCLLFHFSLSFFCCDLILLPLLLFSLSNFLSN